MRIFLDANIVFSAAKTDGAIMQLLKELVKQKHALWVDGFVLEEAHRNLALKAPDRVDRVVSLAHLWHEAPVLPHHASPTPDVGLPEKDRPVLAAAIHHRCGALVTGDRTHFGALYGKTISGVQIHSPRSLAETVLR